MVSKTALTAASPYAAIKRPTSSRNWAWLRLADQPADRPFHSGEATLRFGRSNRPSSVQLPQNRHVGANPGYAAPGMRRGFGARVSSPGGALNFHSYFGTPCTVITVRPGQCLILMSPNRTPLHSNPASTSSSQSVHPRSCVMSIIGFFGCQQSNGATPIDHRDPEPYHGSR
jgi:hypothetical protein